MAERGLDISAVLPLNLPGEALLRLENGDPLTNQDAMTVIRANAVDGEVFRKVAEEGHVNVVKFLLNAKDRFHLTDKEKERCSNEGAANENDVTPLHLAASNGHVAVVEAILSSGASVNVQTSYYAEDASLQTPLHFAAKAGHREIVHVLLSSGADIEARDKQFRTALHWSSVFGHFSVVQLLLMNNATACVVDIDNSSPLDIAIEGGYRNTALLLLSHKSSLNKTFLLNSAIRLGRNLAVFCLLSTGVELTPIYGLSPLHVAVFFNQTELAKILVWKGASVNFKDEDGDTPLHFACFLEGRENIIEVLLKHGNIGDEDKQTLLMKCRHLPVQQMLIQDGADVNIPDNNGRLLLHRARSVKFAQLLLENNVLVDARDFEGSTALHYACKEGCTAVAELLIEHGASVNTMDCLGQFPLECAVQAKEPDVVRVLLDNDADANVVTSHGEYLLHLALECPEVVRLLLERNVDVNATDLDLKTPLHTALGYFYPDTVRLLVDHGAKVNAVDRWGRTPLHLAARWGEENIVELLLQNGADVSVRDGHKHTPLETAVKFARSAAADLLKRHEK